MKTAYMVVTAALFSTGVTKTSDTISARERPENASSQHAASSATWLGNGAAPWASKDPADSLYREARAALGKGDYARAADLFRRIYSSTHSAYAGESLYYLRILRSIASVDPIVFDSALYTLTLIQRSLSRISRKPAMRRPFGRAFAASLPVRETKPVRRRSSGGGSRCFGEGRRSAPLRAVAAPSRRAASRSNPRRHARVLPGRRSSDCPTRMTMTTSASPH